jgi:3-deoxy-7-phosphoheptulonate synthase
LLIEVHPHPDKALCDGEQSLSPASFANVLHDLRRVAAAVDRCLL